MAVSPRFVFVVYEAGNFASGLELCVALRGHGLGAPVMFSPYFLPDTERYIAAAAQQAIAYVHEATALGGWADPFAQLRAAGIGAPAAAEAAPGQQRAAVLPRLRSRLAARIVPGLEAATGPWEAHYRERIAVASRFLRAAGARALILPEENVERDSACWCRAMGELGGRSIVVSYGTMDPDEAARAYFESPDHQLATAADARFARLYPKWATTFGGRRLLRLPAARAFAMERLALAPRNPWIVNSGGIDAIVVESRFMRDRFTGHGIAGEKVLDLGHVSQDLLAEAAGRREAIREEWAGRYGHPVQRPVLLCAMPPNQYPGVKSPEFDTYEALVDGWLEALASMRPTYFPAVSPHPNISAEIRARVAAAGFPVLDGGAARWIPACDLYAASVSSTIKSALACGKPVVDYDCYRYRQPDFLGIDAVVPAGDHAAFLTALQKFRDEAWRLRMAREAEKDSGRYGIVDGKAAERIAAFLREGEGKQ